MYNSFQLAAKYLQYFFSASNGKGHGVHSPFVYDFIVHVLNGKNDEGTVKQIENLRAQLLSDDTTLQIRDLGAGSRKHGLAMQRSVKQVAQRALKPKKYAALLQRIAAYYACRHVVELGTSLGITTAYLASAAKVEQVNTMEGVESIAASARKNLDSLAINHVNIHTGNFDELLPAFVSGSELIDMLYIDGNHRLEPTLRYFETALPKLHEQSVVVFDDIHWSNEMEQAWKQVKRHTSVTLTIDLFYIGLVFLSKNFKEKQHFTIRF